MLASYVAPASEVDIYSRGTQHKENMKTEEKSKETYGQTRGLGNLEMKHIGELAITGVLLNAVKTEPGLYQDRKSVV